jgi:hypothetical protein
MSGHPEDYEIRVPQPDGSFVIKRFKACGVSEIRSGARKARSLKKRSQKGQETEGAAARRISMVEALVFAWTAYWVGAFGWKSLGSVRGFSKALLAVSFVALLGYIVDNCDRWLSSLRERSRGSLKQPPKTLVR